MPAESPNISDAPVQVIGDVEVFYNFKNIKF